MLISPMQVQTPETVEYLLARHAYNSVTRPTLLHYWQIASSLALIVLAARSATKWRQVLVSCDAARARRTHTRATSLFRQLGGLFFQSHGGWFLRAHIARRRRNMTSRRSLAIRTVYTRTPHTMLAQRSSPLLGVTHKHGRHQAALGDSQLLRAQCTVRRLRLLAG